MTHLPGAASALTEIEDTLTALCPDRIKWPAVRLVPGLPAP